MFKVLVIYAFSLSSFACVLPEIDLQKQVFAALIAEHSSGDKGDSVKTIRKIDFLPNKRLRFLYVSNANRIKNIIQTYKVDTGCKVSLDKPFYK